MEVIYGLLKRIHNRNRYMKSLDDQNADQDELFFYIFGNKNTIPYHSKNNYQSNNLQVTQQNNKRTSGIIDF